jgi:hypothetical protein
LANSPPTPELTKHLTRSCVPSLPLYRRGSSCSMVRKRQLDPQSIFDEPGLMRFLGELGIKDQHGPNFQREVIERRPERLDDMPSIFSFPLGLERTLARHFEVTTSRVVEVGAGWGVGIAY